MGTGATRMGEGCGRSGQQIPMVGKIGGKTNKLNKRNLLFALKKKIHISEKIVGNSLNDGNFLKLKISVRDRHWDYSARATSPCACELKTSTPKSTRICISSHIYIFKLCVITIHLIFFPATCEKSVRIISK